MAITNHRSIRNFVLTLPLVAGAAVSLHCDDPAAGGIPDAADAAVTNYAAIVEASYADSVAAAQALDAAIQAFVAAPSEATLQAARDAWLASREPYLQTEAYRFYDGPIDHPETGPEGLINAWPLDEVYIDYVEGNPSAGIVNNPAIVIDAATLESLNEAGGEANIATGYHAIEFLLWGQDLSATGPGARPYTDFVTDGTGTAQHQDRRAAYLTTVSTMLVGHLQGVHAQWAVGGAYRSEFEGAEPADALTRILSGLIVLSGFETGGERLQTALDSGDQEDEHSCFSDNTHRDMIQDIVGISNVWHGEYTRTDGSKVTGKGIYDVVAEVDAELAKTVSDEIAASSSLALAMQTPFDREIALDNPAGRARVQALVDALRAQENSLSEVFALFELDVPVVE